MAVRLVRFGIGVMALTVALRTTVTVTLSVLHRPLLAESGDLSPFEPPTLDDG